MAFPAGLTLVSVHAAFDVPPDGGASGTVRYTCRQTLTGGADNAIVPPWSTSATLDASGECAVQLPATNDPDWVPTGWAYDVVISVGAATVHGTLQLDYQATSVELADLLQVDGAAEAGTTYATLPQLAAVQADLDAAEAEIDGKLSLTGGTITGNLVVQDDGADKAYRLKTSGASLDLDASGSDLYLSNFSAAGFGGTQRTYLRLESGSQLAHAIGRWLVASGPFAGTGVADLDPDTGVGAIGAKNGLTNIRLCGYRASTGAPTTGTWDTGDLIIDSAGAWHLCTAGGTPGTWT